MPIKINRAVQTGPNSHAGGLKLDFFKDSYQIGIERLVKIDPIKPATKQIIILIANFKISLLFIFNKIP